MPKNFAQPLAFTKLVHFKKYYLTVTFKNNSNIRAYWVVWFATYWKAHNFLSVFVFIKGLLIHFGLFFPVFKVFIGIPSEARLFSNSDLVYLYQLFANVSTALVTFFSLTSIFFECLPIIFQIPQILSTQNTK